MKTVKSKVCVYDCKKHKVEILEKELPVFEPPKPTPSPLETALYHLCKLIDPQNDSVLDEYAMWFENEFGITYKPTVKFVTESELTSKIDSISSSLKKIESVIDALSKANLSLKVNDIKAGKGGCVVPSNTSSQTFYIKLADNCAGLALLDVNIHTDGGRISLYSGEDIVSTTSKLSKTIAVVIPYSLYLKIVTHGPSAVCYGGSVNGKVLTVG